MTNLWIARERFLIVKRTAPAGTRAGVTRHADAETATLTADGAGPTAFVGAAIATPTPPVPNTAASAIRNSGDRITIASSFVESLVVDRPARPSSASGDSPIFGGTHREARGIPLRRP